MSVYPWCEFTSPFLYPSLLSQTRISTIPSSHATGRDPLRHTFDPLIEGSSWSKRLSFVVNWVHRRFRNIWTLRMGLCSGAEREFACTGEAEPRGSSCVLYDTYNTFCTIHIRNIGRYEWASVVCRKAQVVQSLPHHAEYGRSGAEREFLRSV